MNSSKPRNANHGSSIVICATRRFGFAALGMVLFVLSGPSVVAADVSAPAPPTAAPEIVLEMGYLSAPLAAESWINGVVASFERAHPGIKVNLVRTTVPLRRYEPIETIPDLPANVIGIDSEPGYEIQYLVDRGAIIPLDDFVAHDTSPSFGWGDFYPNVVSSVQYNGKTWGVPWLAWTQVLVCNMAVLKEAGITEPPKTWDDVLAYAAKVRAMPHAEGKPEYWGMHMSVTGDSVSHTYAAMALQKGPLFHDGKFDFDTEGVRTAISTFRALIAESGAVQVDERSIADVMADTSAKYGMHLAENHELNGVLANKQLRVVALPTEGQQVSAGFRRLYFAVRKSTPELEAASYELIKWFSRKDVEFPRALVGAPCRRDFVERPEFTRLAAKSLGGLEVLYTSVEQSVEPTAPAMGRFQAFYELEEVARQVVAGAISIDQFVASANDMTNKHIRPLTGTASDSELYK